MLQTAVRLPIVYVLCMNLSSINQCCVFGLHLLMYLTVIIDKFTSIYIFQIRCSVVKDSWVVNLTCWVGVMSSAVFSVLVTMGTQEWLQDS